MELSVNGKNENINTLLWSIKDTVLEYLELKVKQELPRNQISISALSDNNNIDENLALIIITYEVIRRLVRDKFIEPTKIENKYIITQNYYNYLKIKNKPQNIVCKTTFKLS